MFSEQHKKKVETTATGLPLNAAGIPLEGPTVMTQGLPAGLTPGLEFKKVEHQSLASSGGLQATAVPPLVSTGQLPAAAAVPIGTQQTFVEKIPVASAGAATLPAATSTLPAANFSAIPPVAQGFVQGGVIPPVGAHQSYVERIPVTETQATEFRRKSLENSTISTGVPLASTTALPATGLAAPAFGATAIPVGTQQTFVEKIPATSAGTATLPAAAVATTAVAATTAATAAPVLTYTGIQYDIPCYIFSWSDDLHIEIPKVAKKAIGTSRATTGAVNVINEAVYAHKGRHLPARKKRQRWIFSKEGFIISEYHPDYVLTCFNNTVTVQRREAIATGLPAATVGAPVSSLASTGVCQQWILKPSTDSNYFYICCAKNPSLAVDIEKTGELIHKGYPLVVRPLGNLSTAWSYDPK